MSDANGKTPVLVADDRPANRLAFEVLLDEDYEVVLADSGIQALRLSETRDFAVIILDVRMPLLDGFETAIELRRREKTRATPIVFTSASDNIPVSIFAQHPAGLTDFVQSPVDPDIFKFKVATLAVVHQRNRELRRQIEALSERVRLLQAELTRTVPPDRSVEAQIEHLLRLSDEIKRDSLCPAALPR